MSHARTHNQYEEPMQRAHTHTETRATHTQAVLAKKSKGPIGDPTGPSNACVNAIPVYGAPFGMRLPPATRSVPKWIAFITHLHTKSC